LGNRNNTKGVQLMAFLWQACLFSKLLALLEVVHCECSYDFFSFLFDLQVFFNMTEDPCYDTCILMFWYFHISHTNLDNLIHVCLILHAKFLYNMVISLLTINFIYFFIFKYKIVLTKSGRLRKLINFIRHRWRFFVN